MNNRTTALTALVAGSLFCLPAAAQSPDSRPASAMVAAAPTPSYADLADMMLVSPVVVDATIRSTARIKGAEAAGVAAGRQRLYVQADVAALIRGQAGLPQRVGFLADVATDARGRVPSLKKQRVLLFARRVPGSPDQLQLAGPNARIMWSPAADARVRQIARELVAPDAPPTITGIGNAFHVPGALPGEGETQVFLQTADARPVSLSILRRPGEQPRWSVSLGEIVEEGAAPPARDTLLWYRLACSLPATLPASAVDQLSPADASQAQTDYRVVIDALGACGRTRGV
ncbi:hypothetical protein Q5H91_05995 [Sphingomonas sp. KR1UV-12]|uniref:Uncharacterized protein n=2 Tax=Sphingomonas aurea TaxID=3063994 RepID=A0ABT9EIG3_9SPHN|nr:hypothetical protein [Sphingomonas sp. KR1UV-12]MDP1026755.1 hypothetical protein [Sphingomonas sp. KR1UV-12]